MQAVNTKHGWLILDGDRWLGPGIGWQESPCRCRYCFNSEAAANATIASLAEILAAETMAATGKAKAATKANQGAKRVRVSADGASGAKGDLF